MSGDAHVRFCESQELQYPWPLTYEKRKNKCVKKHKVKKKARKSSDRKGSK
jgi:hypothetical protein